MIAWGRAGLQPIRSAVMLLLAASAVGGCASFSGMPEPVISVREAVQIPARFRPEEALARYHSNNPARRDGMSPQQWRNAVVLVRMGAADARYHEFRMNLSREVRGANFGIESTILGLSGLGTVSGESTANALAAVVAALTGARAALNREVYFERTLPALIAGMEVSRLEVATRILVGLGKSENDYPLEVALLDALAYERAASLDQAIQIVTAEATREAAEARQIYTSVSQQLGIIPETRFPTMNLIRDNLDALALRATSGDAAAKTAIDSLMTELSLARTANHLNDTVNARLKIGAMDEVQLGAFVAAMRARGVELGRPVS